MQLGSGVVDLLSGLPAWQGFLVLVGSGVALALAIRVLGDRLLKRVTPHIEGDVDDVVFRGIHTAVYVTVGLGGAYAGAQIYKRSRRMPRGLTPGLNPIGRGTND